ncbi:hypothetical protein ACYOEI_24045 [Singulisphaera rosea]
MRPRSRRTILITLITLAGAGCHERRAPLVNVQTGEGVRVRAPFVNVEVPDGPSELPKVDD